VEAAPYWASCYFRARQSFARAVEMFISLRSEILITIVNPGFGCSVTLCFKPGYELEAAIRPMWR
jgi:hypothetical protein